MIGGRLKMDLLARAHGLYTEEEMNKILAGDV
jgi:hypothetical protein